MTEPVLHAFEFNRKYVHQLLADVPDDRICEQPGKCLNHAAWQIGHLTVILGYAGTMLGLDTMLDERWLALFDRGSSPTGKADAYPRKPELLDKFDELHAALARGFREASNDVLNQPTPEQFKMRAFAPTIRDAVSFLMTWHEGMHAGQLATWRKILGYPNVL